MRVLVATGSSGGHIFPALALLDSLKDMDKTIDCLLVMPKTGINPRGFPEDVKVKYISTSKIDLNFKVSNFMDALKLLKGAFQSLVLILEFKPDIVVGFGSIDSVPTLFFAWLARIPTLIHEQNVIPGRANKLLAKFCDRIAVTFAETKTYFGINPKRLAVTGNPLRKQMKKINKPLALKFFGLDKARFTILVMGGSLGSHKINTCFFQALSDIKVETDFQAIHISGYADYETLERGYLTLSKKIKLFSFLKDIHYAYSASDFVISRAGATTIWELLFFRLPAIIIPYPFAYQHQLNNAKVLRDKGCALVIDDFKLSPGLLKGILEQLMADPDRLNIMRSGYDNFFNSFSAELLRDQVLSLYAHKN